MFLPLLLPLTLPAEADTLRSFDIEEAVVVAQPKETAALRAQAASVSLFDASSLQRRGISAAKDLSALAPGFYMPAYGSRLTSAAYVRGVGSRSGQPAVGLYVDNIPYPDKTAYDFTFAAIDRVDILRGPQGTLYGAGTQGGLVRVFTADPFAHHGTTLSAGWTSRIGGRRVSATTYLHPGERVALSLSAYYNGQNGAFRNAATGEKQDGSDVGGGRLRLAWRPSERVRLDWTASYEYSHEDACPYFWDDATDETQQPTGRIEQNRPSSYRRSLFNTGLSASHTFPRFVLTSTTAYQHLADRLFMDQDFTAADIFSLCQEQQLDNFSEELALRSRRDDARRWQWTTGLYFQYQHAHTDCPVTFYGEGIDYLNGLIGANLPTSPQVSVSLTGSSLPFVSTLKTPALTTALFHQSTVRLVGGLSATLGLRLDYDHRSLDLRSGIEGGAAVPYHFAMSMGPTMSFSTDLEADATLNGHLRSDRWQVLPKAALNYELADGLGNVYLSVSKGYRAGGYNIQSYSDLSQSLLRRQLMLGVRDYSVEQINALPRLPEAAKQGAIAGMTSVLDKVTPAAPDVASLYYKPEYTWSYEFGLHHNLCERLLQLDLSAYYMRTRDQQISRFSESGMGRVLVNAGRSRSAGVEVSLRSLLLSERLQLSAAYGFTSARFTDYDLGAADDAAQQDYNGNRVPYVPAHTLSAAASFRQPIARSFVEAVEVGADVRGAGDIYWDEANTHSSVFYAVVGARLALEMRHGLSLSLWAKNLTATRYTTFSFESMDRRFAQFGQPRTFGVDLSVKF